MTTPTGLELVWANAGGTTDPGNAKYQLGWVAEIPTFQNFNHVLQTLDKTKLSFAESDIYPWQDKIAYVKGARVLRSTVRYTCITSHNDSAGTNPQDPTLDTTNSYWVTGTLLSAESNAVLSQEEGLKLDRINKRTSKTIWQGNDATLNNESAVLALNTPTVADDNFLFANVQGKIVVVNVGTKVIPDGTTSLLPSVNNNAHHVFHEGNQPDVTQVTNGLEKNPEDGVLYGRRDGNWVKVTATSISIAPPPPVAGDGAMWYNLDDGTTYVDIDDGDSSQWVPVSPPVVTGIAAINDLTQAYEYIDRTEMVEDTNAFIDNKVLHVGERVYKKLSGSTPDIVNSPNLLGGGYAEFQPEKTPLTGKPLKIKPSINEFISKALTETAHTQIKLGDGRVSSGQSATDLVYRTAHNSLGGTDGSFAITSRYAIEILDVVNTVLFTIQLDSALLTGVVPQLLVTNDPNLSTASISYVPLVDNGGGNYSFGPWTPSGGATYYGFEVKLTPTNTDNDATLHDEYFVIQDMTIVQNGNDLLDQTEVLSDSTWAQQVLSALPKTFSTQTLPSAAANDVFITHTQLISGSSYRYAYVSPSGLATNDGSEFSPFNIEFVSGLVSAGAIDLLFMIRESENAYTYSGKKPRDIFTIVNKHQRILCTDPLGILIDTSFALPFGSMTSVSSHFEISYNEVNHFNAATIGLGTTSPKIVMDTLTKNFTEVLTAGEVDGLDYSFYWDNSAKKFLLRFDGTLIDSVHVPESGNLFIGENIGYFGAANIKMKGVQAALLDLDVGDYYETYNTGSDFGNAAGEGYNIDGINGTQVDDYFIKCQADAFNYHGFGHTDIFDCIADYCKDDGISHHDSCTGFIQGGRYDNNSKGGVIPAFGAYVVCVNVSATGNKLGDSPLAQAGNFGGFVCLSNDADVKETTLICHDCIGEDNKYNFLSTGGKSNLVVYRSDNVSSISEDFASLTWASNILGGRLDVIQSNGSFASIAGQEDLVNIKV